MAEKSGRRFLEDCVGQQVKYADSHRKQVFEGTLEHDYNRGIYYIATGGRLKPIICLENKSEDFIVCDGEILDKDGRYESLDWVGIFEDEGIANIDETDSRFKTKKRSMVETDTGKILNESTERLY